MQGNLSDGVCPVLMDTDLNVIYATWHVEREKHKEREDSMCPRTDMIGLARELISDAEVYRQNQPELADAMIKEAQDILKQFEPEQKPLPDEENDEDFDNLLKKMSQVQETRAPFSVKRFSFLGFLGV